MDSKRKANGTASAADEMDERGGKRRKLSETVSAYGETPESTTQVGLELLEIIKNCKDKSGRAAAPEFLTLPSRKELPYYYVKTRMPIAIDMIEAKLNNREFPTLTTLESYWKRLVQNAKEYNEKESLIHKDAERIRKIVATWMQKHNPAYRDPKYVPYPTPIPVNIPRSELAGAAVGDDVDAEGESDRELASTDATASATPTSETPGPKRKPGRPFKNPASELEAQRRASSMPGADPSSRLGGSFNGLTFQQAQEKILEEMVNYKEDEDEQYPTFDPFMKLPDRKLRDYYHVVSHPVSFNTLKKRIRGSHGKGEASGITDLKSWDAFEAEVSHIWKNAWRYNEDSSTISVLAKDLEIFFNKRLAAAKKVVPEPPQPKLKLKVSAPEPAPKIMLRMGVKESPAETPIQTPSPIISSTNVPQSGITVRGTALAGASTGTPSLVHIDRGRSISRSVASPTLSVSAPVKSEGRPSPSILPSATVQTTSVQNGTTIQVNGSVMPSPARISPGVPTNGALLNGISTAGHGYGQPSPYHVPPTPSLDSKWRPPGKDASDAMITNLQLSTHPGLHLTRHFKMNLPASATMAQQSITINFPSTHYYLQIKPSIAPSLMERQHKLFVTSGTQRLVPMPQVPGQPIDHINPLFEARLLPGVNRIEVELIAALPKGAPKPPSGPDVELEKITIFANLLR